MTDPRQFTINFEEWDVPAASSAGRPCTPASEDVRSVAMRAKILSEAKEREPLYYISFGSGSSGNSCYIGTTRGGVIVDCGVRPDVIEDTLAANGVGMDRVKGVCLTHDHSDHVRYVYRLLLSHRHLRLYCTNRVLNARLRRHGISKRVKDYHQPVFKEFPFKLGDFEVTAFDVPHDAADNAGFSFSYGQRNFVMATDLGAVSERARHYMAQADFLMIEANYDLHMLRHGPYPEYLKARIATDHGHLDNADTAAFVSEIATSRLRHVFLCHLSNDNNRPELALKVVRDALEARGIKVGAGEESISDRAADMQLMVLPRFEPTRWMVLR